jgi:hypothetical protein
MRALPWAEGVSLSGSKPQNRTPIGVLILGWADSERVTALQLIALAGVLACVIVVQWGAAAPLKAAVGNCADSPRAETALAK